MSGGLYDYPASNYREEFPSFGELDVQLPAGFRDASWHNDACPHWEDAARGLEIWIDYADPEMSDWWDADTQTVRGYEEPSEQRTSAADPTAYPRFILQKRADPSTEDYASGETLLRTGDWAEVLAFIDAYRPEDK